MRALFGAFRLVVVALRQQGFLRRAENPSKIATRGVRSSFWRADFCPGKEKPAGNTRKRDHDRVCRGGANTAPEPSRMRGGEVKRVPRRRDAARAQIRRQKPTQVRLPSS